jgi:hypothetical protein
MTFRLAEQCLNQLCHRVPLITGGVSDLCVRVLAFDISQIQYITISLTFYSLVVNLHTTRFNTKEFYTVLMLGICVLHGSQNKR